MTKLEECELTASFHLALALLAQVHLDNIFCPICYARSGSHHKDCAYQKLILYAKELKET